MLRFMPRHCDALNVNLATLIAVYILFTGAFPFTAKIYESSMMMHMLIQLPMLILIGCLIPLTHPRLITTLAKLDPHAVIALVIFIGCTLFWMLPVNLDLAVSEPLYRFFKLVSVPIGIGLSFKWIWLRAHIIVKIVVLFELWAAVTRLGWLYLESPEQLCSNYLIGEQRTVGTVLLGISLICGVIGLIVGVFGTYSDTPNKSLAESVRTG